MRDAQLRAVLHGLGIDEHTSHALLLLPLVEVAWADGRIQDKERKLITRVAHERGMLSADGERLLESWLRFRPSDHYLARGRMALVELAHRGAGEGLDPRSLDDVVGLCEDVASAAGGLFDRWGSVHDSEKAAIADIAEALAIDPDVNRDELLGDAPHGGLPIATGPAPLHEPGFTRQRFDEADFDITDACGEIPDLDALFGAIDADTLTEASPPPAVSADAAAAVAAVARAGVGPRLVLASDDAAPTTFPLEGHTSQIGRRPDCAVHVRWDGEVSRQHCRLFREDDRWYVADSGSINGTFVDDERVLERRLFGGEQVRVGQTRFHFAL